jgi:HEAT repeat protein
MTARVGACAIALAVVPAWRAAPQVKPAPDLTTLVATLKSTDPATRAKSACALRDLGGRATAAVDALAALLPDASPVDQQICGQRWRSDDTSSPGEFAAAALASIGSPAYAVLERTLQHDIWIARRNAAWALGVLDDPRAVPALIATLTDREAPVRKQAAWALGVIGNPRAVEPLLGALKDRDPEVRRQAAWAIGVLAK